MFSEHDGADADPLDRIIAEYLSAVEAGQAPDREALLRRHAGYAEELRAFFADHDGMEQVRRDLEGCGLPPRSDAGRGGADRAAASPAVAPRRRETCGDGETVSVSDLAEGRSPLGAQGRRFGDFELLEEIARGGMGVVYKARQVSLNRVVALKMILAGEFASSADIERFYREAEAAANLDHPHIVPIYEVGEYGGLHYYSMGFVEGESLAHRLEKGPLPPHEAARHTKRIAEAIAYAHRRGVIHRDLKPGNVLLDRNGEPRVADFGLAKRVDTERGLTATGQIVGTPSYMAPEQAAGNVGATNESADIYSLGAILYALLTGRPPFQADHPVRTVLQVLQQDVQPPRQRNARIPRDLENICLRCLEKEPDQRYASAGELADDLGRFLVGEPVIARPLSWWRRLRRWARNQPGLATTWAAVGAFYLYHACCYWVLRLPDLTPQFHRAATALCVSWCVGAALFQRRLRGSQRTLFLFVWATWDVSLLTVFLFVTDSAKSPLALVYHVLVASAVMRSHPALVGYVTALALAGYATHVGYTCVYRPDLGLRFAEVLPFALSLAVIGLIQYLALTHVRVTEEPNDAECPPAK